MKYISFDLIRIFYLNFITLNALMSILSISINSDSMGSNDTDRDLMIKHLNVWTNKIKIKCTKIGLLPSFKTFSLIFNLFKIYNTVFDVV